MEPTVRLSRKVNHRDRQSQNIIRKPKNEVNWTSTRKDKPIHKSRHCITKMSTHQQPSKTSSGYCRHGQNSHWKAQQAYNGQTVQNGKGGCSELGNNIFLIGDVHQADKFSKTLEIIVNYIHYEYEYGKDVAYALRNFPDYDFTPELPTVKEAASEAGKKVQEMILSQEVREYVSRQSKYRDNMSKAYALILGQCTTGLKNNWKQGKIGKTWRTSQLNCSKQLRKLHTIIKTADTQLL